MGDSAATGVRERIWVTKFDHSVDPPRPVEEVFIENGAIVDVKKIEQQQEKERQDGTETNR